MRPSPGPSVLYVLLRVGPSILSGAWRRVARTCSLLPRNGAAVLVCFAGESRYPAPDPSMSAVGQQETLGASPQWLQVFVSYHIIRPSKRGRILGRWNPPKARRASPQRWNLTLGADALTDRSGRFADSCFGARERAATAVSGHIGGASPIFWCGKNVTNPPDAHRPSVSVQPA